MDINTLRVAVEVLFFVFFIGVIAWAFNPRRRAELERSGRSVLDD
jgi:cbb3-type cytochrome oxidase subunit 3